MAALRLLPNGRTNDAEAVSIQQSNASLYGASGSRSLWLDLSRLPPKVLLVSRTEAAWLVKGESSTAQKLARGRAMALEVGDELILAPLAQSGDSPPDPPDMSWMVLEYSFTGPEPPQSEASQQIPLSTPCSQRQSQEGTDVQNTPRCTVFPTASQSTQQTPLLAAGSTSALPEAHRVFELKVANDPLGAEPQDAVQDLQMSEPQDADAALHPQVSRPQAADAAQDLQMSAPQATDAAQDQQMSGPQAENAAQDLQTSEPRAANASQDLQMSEPLAANAAHHLQASVPQAENAAQDLQMSEPQADNAADDVQMSEPQAAQPSNAQELPSAMQVSDAPELSEPSTRQPTPLELDTEVDVAQTGTEGHGRARRGAPGAAGQRQSTLDAFVRKLPVTNGSGSNTAPRSSKSDGLPGNAINTKLVSSSGEIIKEIEHVIFTVPGEIGEQRAQSRLAGAELSQLWSKELEELRSRCKMPRTLIGVVGDTGAGKSSLINTILGEEDMVPTNGMRACTACAVEISYSMDRGYYAEIEIVSHDEWASMVDSMWEDLKDPEDPARLVLNLGAAGPDANTEKGAAQASTFISFSLPLSYQADHQAVLEAVYGRQAVRKAQSKEELLELSNGATRHLGKCIKVGPKGDAKAFRREVGVFVDSHDAVDAATVQNWPLVKVCKIRHNWKVLEEGAVLVDLPGVRDANLARGRVAEAYLKKCQQVWVVAAITRAVDSKSAKDLLGQQFRRQMMMDGQYGQISFICTKTDDIDATGTIRALGVEGVCERAKYEMGSFLRLEQQLSQLTEEEIALMEQRKSAKKEGRKHTRRFRALVQEVKLVQERLREKMDGDELKALISKGNAACSLSLSSFDAQGSDSEDEQGGSSEEEDEGSSDPEYEAPEREAQPSDEEMPSSSSADDMFMDDDEDRRQGGQKRKAKKQKKATGPTRAQLKKYTVTTPLKDLLTAHARVIVSLETERSLAREKAGLLKAALGELTGVREKLQRGQMVMRGVCAKARNSYSKERLQQDFKDGMTAMEEAACDRQGKAAQVPELAVFCVSCKEANKLEGRFKRDGRSVVFKNVEGTEVPALRAHVREVAERAREHTLRKLAADLVSFINSVASSLLNQADFVQTMGAAVRALFDHEQLQLSRQLSEVFAGWTEGLRTMWVDQGLKPRLGNGTAQAESKALHTTHGWGAALYFMTYRAVTNRDGVYAGGRRGPLNFNGDLCAPMFDCIAVVWDAMFSSMFSAKLSELKALLLGLLHDFMHRWGDEVSKLGLEQTAMALLVERVLRDEQRRLEACLDKVVEEVQNRQRELSRDVLEPTVQKLMVPAYQAARLEKGPGCYNRMKAAVAQHVQGGQGTMFRRAAAELEALVVHMLSKVVERLRGSMTDMVKNSQSRCSSLWEAPPCNHMDRWKAACELHQLVHRALELCSLAGVQCPQQAFELVESPEAVAQRARAEELVRSLQRVKQEEEAKQMEAALKIKQEEEAQQMEAALKVKEEQGDGGGSMLMQAEQVAGARQVAGAQGVASGFLDSLAAAAAEAASHEGQQAFFANLLQWQQAAAAAGLDLAAPLHGQQAAAILNLAAPLYGEQAAAPMNLPLLQVMMAELEAQLLQTHGPAQYIKQEPAVVVAPALLAVEGTAGDHAMAGPLPSPKQLQGVASLDNDRGPCTEAPAVACEEVPSGVEQGAQQVARQETSPATQQEVQLVARHEVQQVVLQEVQEQERQQVVQQEAQEQAPQEGQQVVLQEVQGQAPQVAQQEVQQEAPPEVQQVVPMEVQEQAPQERQQVVQQEAQEQAPPEVQQVVLQEVQEQAPSEVQQVVPMEVQEEAQRVVQQQAQQEVQQEVQQGPQQVAQQEVQGQAPQVAQQEVQQEAPQEVQQGVLQGVLQEVQEQTPQEVQQVVLMEVQEQALQQGQQVVLQELHEQAPPEVQQVVLMEVQEEAQRVAQQVVPKEVLQEVQQAAQHVAEHATLQEVPEEAQQEAHTNVEAAVVVKALAFDGLHENSLVLLEHADVSACIQLIR